MRGGEVVKRGTSRGGRLFMPNCRVCKLVHGEPMGAALGRRVVPDGYWADGDPSRGPMPASVAIDWS